MTKVVRVPAIMRVKVSPCLARQAVRKARGALPNAIAEPMKGSHDHTIGGSPWVGVVVMVVVGVVVVVVGVVVVVVVVVV